VSILGEYKQQDRFVGKNFDYYYANKYPKGLSLNPNKDAHRAIVKHILECVRESHNVMQRRYGNWAELDKKVNGFIDLSTYEQQLKESNPEKPLTIVIPQSYATKEVLLTYNASAFLRQPIFRYEPSGDPNDTLGVILLESLIQQQVVKARMGLNLHTMWSDDITYSFGAVAVNFEKTLGTKTRNGIRKEVVKYQGNRLRNLDPYNSYPDIHVPIWNTEDMEYFAWVDRRNYSRLFNLESLDSSFFNIRYLEKISNGKSQYYNSNVESGRYAKTNVNPDNRPASFMASKPIDVIWCYCTIIPKDLGLGRSTTPELWRFALAADSLIIAANPVELDHGGIPIAVCSIRNDGHSLINPSILEIEYPIQHGMDWLWGTHVSAIRKTVNNMLLIDPSLININDFMDSRAGLLARLRPQAWGRSMMDQAVKQLDIKDITQNNISDIGFLRGMADSSMGTSDQARGIQNRRGERVSSAEARGTMSALLGRHEKDAKIAAMQANYSIAYQMASNTLQFMEGEQRVKILGDYAAELSAEYSDVAREISVDRLGNTSAYVSLDNLDVDYDVVIQDGTIPSGEYADTWTSLLTIASKSPEVFKELNFTRIWLHIARLMGAHNASDFRKVSNNITSRVAGDQEINNQVSKGNLVSLAELGGQDVSAG